MLDSGGNVSESGSGTQAAYSGSHSWHEHTHSYVPGDPPYDYVYDSSWNEPFSGTIQLDGSPLYLPVPWRAEDPAAENFSFHGQNEISGTLSETATWGDGRLDIDSFSSTWHDRDIGHLIEDEPGEPYYATASEDYHKDGAEKGTLLILTAYPPKSMMSPFPHPSRTLVESEPLSAQGLMKANPRLTPVRATCPAVDAPREGRHQHCRTRRCISFRPIGLARDHQGHFAETS